MGALRDLLRAITATGWAAIVTLLVLMAVLGWCASTADGRKVAKVEARASPAREVAAEERQTDTQTIQYRQQERDHDAEAIPDGVPDDRELTRGHLAVARTGVAVPCHLRQPDYEAAAKAGRQTPRPDCFEQSLRIKMDIEAVPRRAAQYVRMSTERQDGSIQQQTTAIASYAAARGYEIVRTYADEGISGLLIERRNGLKAMLSDVLAGSPGFEVVLVYDVSRWGRFQNPDQAAHYEFVCVDAGVTVEYCAEQFTNDGSFSATLLKNLKRMMAAEYSRELSAKVVHAKDQLGAAGYWQGGPPGYGLRRQHILPDGSPGRVLESGERKGPQNGRTRLVAGPPEEVEIICDIFRMFVVEKLGITTVARRLNESGHCRAGRHPWSAHYIHHVLTSPRYAGTNVVRKSRRRMKATNAEYLPRSEWICVPGAFEALIDQPTFDAAQARLERNRTPLTDRQMLDGLARVLKRHGRLSAKIIDAARDLPPSHRFVRRFGTMNNAYRLVGYEPDLRQTSSSLNLQANRRQSSARHAVDALGAIGVVMRLRALVASHGRLSMNLINDELGRAAYQLVAARFGGGRRLYALAGYKPSKVQNSKFNRSWDETLTERDAENLRFRVVSGEAVAIEFWKRAD